METGEVALANQNIKQAVRFIERAAYLTSQLPHPEKILCHIILPQCNFIYHIANNLVGNDPIFANYEWPFQRNPRSKAFLDCYLAMHLCVLNGEYTQTTLYSALVKTNPNDYVMNQADFFATRSETYDSSCDNLLSVVCFIRGASSELQQRPKLARVLYTQANLHLRKLQHNCATLCNQNTSLGSIVSPCVYTILNRLDRTLGVPYLKYCICKYHVSGAPGFPSNLKIAKLKLNQLLEHSENQAELKSKILRKIARITKRLERQAQHGLQLPRTRHLNSTNPARGSNKRNSSCL
jgi:hypothetical protein